MILSAKSWIAAAAVASLLGLGNLASAEPASTEAQAQPAPVQREARSCWHPGLTRNIGIAEPSCDAPMSESKRPGSPNGKNDGAGQGPVQPPAQSGEPKGQ
jgi:hypothetical protein